VDFLHLQTPMFAYSLSYVLSPWSFVYSCYIVATSLRHSKQNRKPQWHRTPKNVLPDWV